MANRNDYHVTPNPNGWGVVKEGAKRASGVYNTKLEAMKYAKEFAIAGGGGDVSIHNKDGKIGRKHTYGKKDPYPPLG